MTIERSHGKARPTLPRSSDAQAVEDTDGKPTEARGPHGHFGRGNRTALGSGLIHASKKLTGNRDATGDGGLVTRDARLLLSHILRSFPSNAAPVRILAAVAARHFALNGFYVARAEQAGLDTAEGIRFVELAARESQRAERTLISAQDMSRVCAKRGGSCAKPSAGASINAITTPSKPQLANSSPAAPTEPKEGT